MSAAQQPMQVDFDFEVDDEYARKLSLIHI